MSHDHAALIHAFYYTLIDYVSHCSITLYAVQEAEFEIGEVIDATVKEVRDIGLMVELAPGVVSLLHIKNLAHEFVS